MSKNTGSEILRELCKTPYGVFYHNKLADIRDAAVLPMCSRIAAESDRTNPQQGFKVVNNGQSIDGDSEVCPCARCTKLTEFLTLARIFTTVSHRQHKTASIFGSEIMTLLTTCTEHESDALQAQSEAGLLKFKGAPEYITAHLLLFHQLIAAAVPLLISSIATFNLSRTLFDDFDQSNKQADDAHFAISQTIALLSDTLQIAIEQFSKGHE